MATTLVSALNQQWREGRPSNVLTEAGLLVHVLDGRFGILNCGYAPCTTASGKVPSAPRLWSALASHDRPKGVATSILSKRSPVVCEPPPAWNLELQRRSISASDLGLPPHLLATDAPTNVPALVRAGLARLPFPRLPVQRRERA